MWEKNQEPHCASWEAETSHYSKTPQRLSPSVKLGADSAGQQSLCLCPAALRAVITALTMAQTSTTISEQFATVSPCFDHRINAALGWSHLFFAHLQSFLSANIMHWNFLKVFACAKPLIAFHLVSKLWSPPLNTTLMQSSPGWMSSQY